MRTYPKWVRKIKLVALYGGGGCIGLFVILFIVIAATRDNEKASSGSAPESPAASAPESPAASAPESPVVSAPESPADALLKAVESGTASEVKAALAAGADPNAENEDGYTPLHEAALYNSNPSVIKALIEGGADPGARNKEGSTPLHMAAGFNSNPAVTTALIEAGADLNAHTSMSRDTPLHTAAIYNSNPAVIVALIEGGADPGARNKYGDTPFKYAKDKKALKGTDAYRMLESKTEAVAATKSEPEKPKLPATLSGVRVESDAIIPDGYVARTEWAVILVKLEGYRCDSISSLTPMTFSPGYTLNCNGYRYTYDLKDVGGNWRVSAD